jgi:hypothetical protein
VHNDATNEEGVQPRNHWDQLDAFLQTDPRDAGCEATMEMLDVYAELVAMGSDPSERFPSLHAHLLACGPCADDLEGLLAAIRGGTPSGSDQS